MFGDDALGGSATSCSSPEEFPIHAFQAEAQGRAPTVQEDSFVAWRQPDRQASSEESPWTSRAPPPCVAGRGARQRCA
jgi:hypothetical protein